MSPDYIINLKQQYDLLYSEALLLFSHPILMIPFSFLTGMLVILLMFFIYEFIVLIKNRGNHPGRSIILFASLSLIFIFLCFTYKVSSLLT